MKKIIAVMTVLFLLLGCCAFAEAPGRKMEFPDNTYVEKDPSYTSGVKQRGQIVMFMYDAQTPDGEAYRKSALAYLPYGYDAADAETRYNVLYLMHGHGGGYTTYFRGAGSFSNMQFVLDAMIEKGRIEPLIVVTPTYTVPGKEEGWCAANFWHELNNYLIPAFESEYHTYAQDVTPEGIRASRTHRAYSGFSMGAMCTWNVFAHCMDEIAYYMPFSGASWSLSAQQLADSVAAAGYTKDDFFIYAGCGGKGDIAYKGMNDMIDAMSALTDTFVFCENFRDGNLYYTQCSGGHSRNTVELIMYAGMPTFFDK